MDTQQCKPTALARIYTDASTLTDGRAGIAMVVVMPDSLVEFTETLTGVSSLHAEMWAVVWALQYAAEQGLSATIFTDCSSSMQFWKRHATTLLPDPMARLAAYSLSHGHQLSVQHLKRGTSIFNRRADHLAGTTLNGGRGRIGLAKFLAKPDMGQAKPAEPQPALQGAFA